MANPIPFLLPDRPDEFQLDRQWAENYMPAFKYGARLDSSQVVGGNITVEDTGIPVGVFDTLDFVGSSSIVDNGDGSVSITVGGGITTITSADGSVTVTSIVGGFDLSVDTANVDWSTTNWNDFFTNADWSQNDWSAFFTNADWSQLTNWNSFVTSLITNWTAGNWDNFIDTFINNVDSDDVFNFLNQIAGLAKGDILVYNGSTWQLLPVGADGQVLTANSATGTGLEYAAGGAVTTAITATANEDMALGTPVGFGADGNIARSVLPTTQVATNIPSPLSSANAWVDNVVEIDTDKYAILYYSPSAPDTLEVVIATIDASTNNITYGTAATVTGSSVPEGVVQNDICKLDTDKFVVVFTRDAANDAEAIVGTVSGTTITFGTKQVLYGAATVSSATCCQLDTDKFGFMYGTSSAGDRYNGFATVSGTVITVVDSNVTALVGVNNNDEIMRSRKIDTDKFVVYNGTGRNAVVATTVGATFTLGAVVQMSTATTGDGSSTAVESIANDTFWIRSGTAVSYGTVVGTVITKEAEVAVSTTNGTLAYDGSDIINFNEDSIDTVTWTGSAISVVPLMGLDVTFTSARGWAADFSGTRYFSLANDNAADPQYHIKGMTANFVGVTQAAVLKSASVTVTVKGETTVSSAVEGTIYDVDGGVFTPTITATNPYQVVGATTTSVIV